MLVFWLFVCFWAVVEIRENGMRGNIPLGNLQICLFTVAELYILVPISEIYITGAVLSNSFFSFSFNKNEFARISRFFFWFFFLYVCVSLMNVYLGCTRVRDIEIALVEYLCLKLSFYFTIVVLLNLPHDWWQKCRNSFNLVLPVFLTCLRLGKFACRLFFCLQVIFSDASGKPQVEFIRPWRLEI